MKKKIIKQGKPSDYFSPNQKLDLLIATCAGTLFLEKMETLKHTPFYSQGTKNLGNQFTARLEQHLSEVINISFQQDEKTMQLIIQGIEDVISNGFSNLRPDEIILAGEVMKGIKNGQITLIDKENPENRVTISK